MKGWCGGGKLLQIVNSRKISRISSDKTRWIVQGIMRVQFDR